MAGKFIAVVLIVLGLGFFGFGMQRTQQTAQKEQKVAQAEENAGGRGRPVVGPVRRQAKNEKAAKREAKVSDAKVAVVESQLTANSLRAVGAILFASGMVVWWVARSRKK